MPVAPLFEFLNPGPVGFAGPGTFIFHSGWREPGQRGQRLDSLCARQVKEDRGRSRPG